MNERITKLEITMAEVGANLKHVVDKLDDIASKMERFTSTHDDVISMKERIKQLDRDMDELHQSHRSDKAKITAITTAIGTVIAIGGQILAYFLHP